MKDLKISYLLDIYGKLLTKTQYEMVDLYYNEDLSLGEIAFNFEISRQGVRDSIKRGETVLLDCEQKLRFGERTLMLSKNIDYILKCVKKIENTCSSNFYSKTVLDEVYSIYKIIDDINIDRNDI